MKLEAMLLLGLLIAPLQVLVILHELCGNSSLFITLAKCLNLLLKSLKIALLALLRLDQLLLQVDDLLLEAGKVVRRQTTHQDQEWLTDSAKK